MTKDSDHIWLSVHLFYNEPWEEFLQQAVEPYVNTAIQTGIVQQYFFIRYWERGPHIRLRLKGEVEMVKAVLKPNIKEHFETYYGSKPSMRKDPTYPNLFPEDSKWLPNNTIQQIVYEPELDRYGGQIGVSISEQHFMLSSQTVLKLILDKGKNWSYDDGMGAAIKLYVTMVAASGFSLEEAISFFEMIHHSWIPHTLGVYQKQMDIEAIEQQTQLTLQSFESSFESQKETLTDFHQNLWMELKEGNSFEDEVMDNWLEENKRIIQQLTSEIQNGNIHERPPSFSYRINKNISKQSELLWQMMSDYIHLTNNRLGIQNKDESYLAFMIMKSLKEVLKKKETKVGE